MGAGARAAEGVDRGAVTLGERDDVGPDAVGTAEDDDRLAREGVAVLVVVELLRQVVAGELVSWKSLSAR